jgi:hypothetical protein
MILETKHPPLPVSQAQRGRWQSALTRGQSHGLQMRLYWNEALGNDGSALHTLQVESSAQRGHYYDVEITTHGDGMLSVWCTCQANRHLVPCQHVALALQHLELWPFDVFAQSTLPAINGEVDPYEWLCSCCGREIERPIVRGGDSPLAACPSDGMIVAAVQRWQWVEAQCRRQAKPDCPTCHGRGIIGREGVPATCRCVVKAVAA